MEPKTKKLKDLKRGDRVIYWSRYPNSVGTTPITVVKARREGFVMHVTLQWDDHEYETVGHPFGYHMVCYNRQWKGSIIFSTDLAEEREWQEMMKHRKLAAEWGQKFYALVSLIRDPLKSL